MPSIRRKIHLTLLGLAAALLTGCGSTALPTSQKGSDAAGNNAAQSFTGVIVDAPATRTIHLEAGEALRWWVRPPAGRDGDFMMGIATALTAPATGGLPSGVPYRNYSEAGARDNDYDAFFSDSPSSPGASTSLRALGTTLVETTHDSKVESTAKVSFAPLLFSDFGRSFNQDIAKGDWIAFVAPQTGNYTLLIGGPGEFTGTFQTQRLAMTPPSAQAFDPSHSTSAFTAAQWITVIQQQVPFLYDTAGYPKDGFSGTYGSTEEKDLEVIDISPGAHRAAVEALLANDAKQLASVK